MQISSFFSAREAWFSFHEAKWNAERQLKCGVNPCRWPSGMPVSKEILSDREIWSVVYLRHRPSAGSLGEPEIYSH